MKTLFKPPLKHPDVRQLRPVALLAVIGVLVLAGCSAAQQPTTPTDNSSLRPADGPEQTPENGITVVEGVNIHNDELFVIHDETRDTYCYKFNDESGDSIKCFPGHSLSDTPHTGNLSIVTETSIDNYPFYVVVDTARGVRCYLSVDGDADAFDCLTTNSQDYNGA